MMNTTTTTTTTRQAASPDHKSESVFPIAFGVSIGALSFLSIVLMATYYACSNKRGGPLRRTASISSNDDDDDETGLDDATLNSYPKLPFSQATNNKSPNNYQNTPENDDEEKGAVRSSSCSICLQEFKDSDVVRVVPDCQHFYHVDCIDTWLKVHRTCPVCRSSPPPTGTGGPWFVQMMR